MYSIKNGTVVWLQQVMLLKHILFQLLLSWWLLYYYITVKRDKSYLERHYTKKELKDILLRDLKIVMSITWFTYWKIKGETDISEILLIQIPLPCFAGFDESLCKDELLKNSFANSNSSSPIFLILQFSDMILAQKTVMTCITNIWRKIVHVK